MMNKFEFHNITKILLILLNTILLTDSFADSPCNTFEIKITYYSSSGKQSTGYVHFGNFQSGKMVFNNIGEDFGIRKRIRANQINYRKIKGVDSTVYDRILAVNKNFMTDTTVTSESGFYDVLDTLRVADKIYNLTWTDTTSFNYYTITGNSVPKLDSTQNPSTQTIYYALTKYLSLDTVKLILLDSILMCGDADQIQWLKGFQVAKLSSEKFSTHFQVVNSETQQSWVDFLSYDSSWKKSRILSSLNLGDIDKELQEYNTGNVFKTFAPSLQNAIKSGKVIYFVRWCP